MKSLPSTSTQKPRRAREDLQSSLDSLTYKLTNFDDCVLRALSGALFCCRWGTSNLGWIVVTQDVVLIVYGVFVGLSLRQQRRSHTLAGQDNKIIIGGGLLYFVTPIIMYVALANSTTQHWLAVVTLCFLAYFAILLAYAYYMIKKIKKQGGSQNGKTPVKTARGKRIKILRILSGCLSIVAILLPANMSGDEGAWIWGLYYPGPHTHFDFLWNYWFVDHNTWIFVFMLLLSAAIVGSLFTILAAFRSDKLRRLRPEKTGPIIMIGTWIAYLIVALTANFDGVIFGWAPLPVGSMVGLIAGILALLPNFNHQEAIPQVGQGR